MQMLLFPTGWELCFSDNSVLSLHPAKEMLRAELPYSVPKAESSKGLLAPHSSPEPAPSWEPWGTCQGREVKTHCGVGDKGSKIVRDHGSNNRVCGLSCVVTEALESLCLETPTSVGGSVPVVPASTAPRWEQGGHHTHTPPRSQIWKQSPAKLMRGGGRPLSPDAV